MLWNWQFYFLELYFAYSNLVRILLIKECWILSMIFLHQSSGLYDLALVRIIHDIYWFVDIKISLYFWELIPLIQKQSFKRMTKFVLLILLRIFGSVSIRSIFFSWPSFSDFGTWVMVVSKVPSLLLWKNLSWLI